MFKLDRSPLLSWNQCPNLGVMYSCPYNIFVCAREGSSKRTVPENWVFISRCKQITKNFCLHWIIEKHTNIKKMTICMICKIQKHWNFFLNGPWKNLSCYKKAKKYWKMLELWEYSTKLYKVKRPLSYLGSIEYI